MRLCGVPGKACREERVATVLAGEAEEAGEEEAGWAAARAAAAEGRRVLYVTAEETRQQVGGWWWALGGLVVGGLMVGGWGLLGAESRRLWCPTLPRRPSVASQLGLLDVRRDGTVYVNLT
jgi:hypothetical protein